PELFLDVFVKRLRSAAGDIHERSRSTLEIGRSPIGEETARVDPAASAAADHAQRDGRPASRGDGARLTRNVFRDRVDDFRTGVVRRLLVTDWRMQIVEDERLSVWRPAHAADRVVVG